MHIIQGHYRIDTTDMVLAAFSESRIYDTHCTQLDQNVCLIILLEVCAVYFDSVCVLE